MSDEERKILPVVPSLEMPSIKPVVPQVSLVLDEPIPKNQLNNNLPKCPGPEFPNFDSWCQKLPSLSSYPCIINRSSTPPSSSSQNGSSFNDVSSLKFELKELIKRGNSEMMFELRRENMEILSQIRQELNSRERKPDNSELLLDVRRANAELVSQIRQEVKSTTEKRQDTTDFMLELRREVTEALSQVRQSLRSQQPERSRVSTCTVATQTATVNFSVQEVQTDGASPSPVPSNESVSDSERELDFQEGGKSFCRAAVEQLDMMINRAGDRQEPAVFGNNLERRPLERMPVLQRPVPTRNYPSTYLNDRQPTEVTLGENAMFQKYQKDLPEELLADTRLRTRQTERTPGKRFAVMNMTNVSVALGYESDRNLPLRGENYACPHGPPLTVPSPPQFRHTDRDYREIRDFAHAPRYSQTPYENYRNYEPAGEDYRPLARNLEGFQPYGRGYGNGRHRDDVDTFEPVARGYHNAQVRDGFGRDYERLTPPERDHHNGWNMERPRNRILDLTAIKGQAKLL